jgi:hypothetical protein
VNDTGKKIILGSGVIVAAVTLGYLALQPGDVVPEVAPLPEWRENRPEVAAAPAMAMRPLSLRELSTGAPTAITVAEKIVTRDMPVASADMAAPRVAEPMAVAVMPSKPLAAAAVQTSSIAVEAGAQEQMQAQNGTLPVATAQIEAPAIPAWLDGWLWPTWRGAAPVAPDGVTPVIVWPAAAPDRPHLLAVIADGATSLKPLAEYLAADAQATAVIIGWEETDHDFRPDAALDAARAEAVAKVVRAARPGLPVWLLCSLTVTGTPEQAAAKVAAAKPDALVLYGLFAKGAWDSDKVVAANLAKGEKLLPGKPVYAAGQRLTDDDLQAAIERARRLSWKGMLCDGSAR